MGQTSAALAQSSGTVVVAADNLFHEGDVSGWTGIVQVAADGLHTLGLRSDGTVAATGYNEAGQCNVSGWTGIVKITAGESHSVGLKADGTVVAVGWNGDGQCNVSGWTGITQIAAGSGHTVGLKSDGTVVAIGMNGSGQCNVSGWSDIVEVDTGATHTVGLKSDGTVVATGYNLYGQCDVSGWTGIVQVAAGVDHTLGLKADGTVVAAGRNYYGQCEVSGWTGIVQIAAGLHHSVGVRANGTVVAAGDNSSQQCSVGGWTGIVQVDGGNYHTVALGGQGVTSVTPNIGAATGGAAVTITGFNLSAPASVRFGGTPATNVSVVDSNTITCTAPARSAGKVNVWLADPAGLFLGLPTANDDFTCAGAFGVGYNFDGECNVAAWTGILGISAGSWHTLGLKSDGTAVAAGAKLAGNQSDVGGWTNLVQAEACGYHSLGVKANGTVVATGDNSEGQCNVSGWTGIVRVAGGFRHSLGLKADGTVVAVGNNNYGQCDLSGWTGIVQVSAGSDFSLGLKADGTVVAAGRNDAGQCDVSGWTGIVYVAAARWHSLGVKADGSVVATGSNTYGQLAATGWTNIVQVAGGERHSLGLKSDGTVVAVGDNANGQCDVSGWRDVVQIAAGAYHSVGLVGPKVTSVTPAIGAAATSVTIKGYGFRAATSVKFGGVAATGVTVVSPTTITCTAPSHSTGKVDVVVTTPAGSSLGSGTADDYWYATRYEQTDGHLYYAGTWSTVSSASASGGSYAQAGSGANMTICFNGTRLDLLATRGASMGKMAVSLDGGTAKTIDLYYSSTLYKRTMYSTGPLASGPHTVRLSYTGWKNAASGGYSIDLDAVDVAGYILGFAEQNDPRLFFQGTWSTMNVAGALGGSYTQAGSTGASVTICFTGTKLDWVATKGPNLGIASFSVDGGAAASVDLYSSGTAYRQLVRSTGSLASGYHTVKIAFTNTKNGSSGGSAINVDAIETTGTILGYAEETSSRFTLAGTWTNIAVAQASGGAFKQATGSSASVTIPFTGTSLAVLATKNASMGSATFSVDGKTPTTASLYSATPLYKQQVFSTGTLTAGYHTVKVAWSTGNALGKFINIDAVRIGGALLGSTRYEQTDSHLVWAGTWALVSNASASGSSFKTANAVGAAVTVNFTGVRLSVLATKAPTYGIMKITVDGTTISTVDLYRATIAYKQTVWSSAYLTPGNHTVKLEWTGTHGSGSTNTISADAVDVWGVLR